MTAGRGIAHSERTPDGMRRNGQQAARPAELDRAAGRARGDRRRRFQHYAAESLPIVDDDGVSGTHHRRERLFGAHSPVRTWCRRWFYAEVTAGARAPACRSIADHEERAIYHRRRRDRDRRTNAIEGPRAPDLPARRPHHRPRKRRRPTSHDVSGRRARWKDRAISGGISFPPAKSGSSRPNRTGKPVVLPMFPKNTSSFRCRSELFLRLLICALAAYAGTPPSRARVIHPPVSSPAPAGNPQRPLRVPRYQPTADCGAVADGLVGTPLRTGAAHVHEAAIAFTKSVKES